MLSRSDFRILTAVRTGSHRYTELEAETGLSKSTISKRVTHLKTLELVRTDTDGKNTVVQRTPTALMSQLDSTQDALSHVDLGSVLSLPLLRVAWFLDTNRFPSSIARFLSIGRERVRELLKQLRERQFAMRTDQGTMLRPEYMPLQALADSVFAHLQEREIEETDPSMNVIWSGPCDALLVPREPTDEEGLDDHLRSTDGLLASGLTEFPRWGLKFFLSEPPIIYRATYPHPTELSVEEVVTHTLARRAEPRRLGYCCLLVARTIIEGEFAVPEFRRLARHFGIEDVAETFLRYLAGFASEDDGASPENPLPSRERVRADADQYGVSLLDSADVLGTLLDRDKTPSGT